MPADPPPTAPSDAYGSPGSAILAMIGGDAARAHHAPPPPHVPGTADGSAILAMIGAGPSRAPPPEAEATLSLKGLLGVAPITNRTALADGPVAGGPAPSGAGANAAASSGLKGLIGVGMDSSAVYPPPAPPGAGNSAGAAAGAQILGMLGVVKGDAAAAGPGDGPAAVDLDPTARLPPPLMPPPVPPAQPPSPGAAILSMLTRDFPLVPARPSPARSAPLAAPAAPAGLLTPGHIASAAPAPPPPQASVPAGHRSPLGAAAAAGPPPLAEAGCDAQAGAQAARGLLAASVATSMAGPAAARMSLPLFKQVRLRCRCRHGEGGKLLWWVMSSGLEGGQRFSRVVGSVDRRHGREPLGCGDCGAAARRGWVGASLLISGGGGAGAAVGCGGRGLRGRALPPIPQPPQGPLAPRRPRQATDIGSHRGVAGNWASLPPGRRGAGKLENLGSKAVEVRGGEAGRRGSCSRDGGGG
jgi:hypothetical protein